MNRLIFSRSFWIVFILGMSACKKNSYVNDGGVSKANVNMTTYDYLKSNPTFSSLAHLIDRAGLKDSVNGNITFFAVTNYGVDEYVSAKKEQRVIALNDENITYTIDSIPVSYFRDSLLTYMFDGKITRDNLTITGKLYNSLLGPIPNVSYEIKLRRVTDQYTSYLDHVDYVNFTKVVGSRDDLVLDPTTIPDAEKDISYDCQTSGIITTTGIVHVLDGYHRLFFNTEKLADH